MSQRRFYLQSPVGNKCRLPSEEDITGGLFDVLGDWSTCFLSSGTAALAAAVRVARQLDSNPRPLVVVPAYGCPDLVAAVRYAGAEPLFVDLAPGSVGYDMSLLHECLDAHDDIIAIIAVDLFGIPEDWATLRALASRHRVVLIQDCAQSVPEKGTFADSLRADMVVFSFGRGKPIFLQGGGALLLDKRVSKKMRAEYDRVCTDAPISDVSYSKIRAAIYAMALKPSVYFWAAKILGDRIGKTEYKKLGGIERMPDSFRSLAGRAFEGYWREPTKCANDVIAQVVSLQSAHPDLVEMPFDVKRNDALGSRLLRLPVLVASDRLRDRWKASLIAAGIGATDMYGRILPAIVCEEHAGVGPEFPVAEDMAGRLLTLPVHERLTTEDIDYIGRCFEP